MGIKALLAQQKKSTLLMQPDGMHAQWSELDIATVT